MKKWFLALGAYLLSVNLAFATPQEAVEQVRENASHVLDIMQGANGKNDAAIRKQVEDYVLPYFDFQRMSELAVGSPAWKAASNAQQNAFTQEFKTLMIRTYSGSMLQFKNAKVVVRNNPLAKRGKNNTLLGYEVHAAISVNGGKPSDVSFAVNKSGGKYRVFNVSVEGISLVTSHRKNFQALIQQKGFDGLINELKAKNGKK